MLPGTIYLFIIFLLIIVLLILKVNLWVNLFLNSLLMGFLFNLKLSQTASILKEVTFNPETIKLLSIIFTIYYLSIILERLKKYDGMVQSLQKLIADYRFVMVFLSSFIALLPIQGGAIFSAPMIKTIGESNSVNPEKNMFINYWFRHIWEFLWPLYPEIILYASLLKISIKNLILQLLPFTVISLLIGILWINRKLTYDPVHIERNMEKTEFREALKEFLENTWPILLVFMLVIFLNMDLLYSLFLALIAIFFLHREIRNQMSFFLLKGFKKSYKTLLLIYSVLFFKEVLEYSQVIKLLPEYFIVKGIPANIVLIVIPFLVSFFTGSIFASIGICVPVFLGFLVNPDWSLNIVAILILYIAAYLGMMVTPLHLCLAITKDFFDTDIKAFYFILIFNLAFFVVFSLIYCVIRTNI